MQFEQGGERIEDLKMLVGAPEKKNVQGICFGLVWDTRANVEGLIIG
jgi:hypothetical protein